MKEEKFDGTVAAVVSVYNGERFIGRCLNSILKQTRPFDEIIVYDDASTDKTVCKIKKYMKLYHGRNIRLLESDVNRGPGGGKNYARKYVGCDYFTYIDADDYISKYYLQRLLNYISEGNKNKPDIVFGGFKKVNSKGRVLYTRVYTTTSKALVGAVSNWGNLYNTDFFEKNGISMPDGKVLDDVLTRALINGCAPIVKVGRNCSDYRYVENEKSVSNTYMKKFVPGAIDMEMDYLHDNLSKVKPGKYGIYEYYAYKVMCWHLLKSGAGVGKEAMSAEVKAAYEKLNEYFPRYKTNRYIKGAVPKGERFVVGLAVKGIYMMEKLGVHNLFFSLYASMDLSFLWPNM